MKLEKSKRGVFLFEVILAISILSLVLLAFVSSLNKTLDATSDEQKLLSIRHELNNYLAETQATPLKVERKNLGTDDRGVSYTREVKALKLTNDENVILDHLYLLTLTANWTDAGKPQQSKIEIYVYQPPEKK